MKSFRAIVFDLDGTLIDSAEGIMNNYRYVAEKIGVQTPSDAILRSFIGPPLRGNLLRFIPETQVDQAVAYYWHSMIDMRRGVEQTKVYDGINELLLSLNEKGIPCCIATNKRYDVAEEIVVHYGWNAFIKKTYGILPSGGGPTKTDLIRRAMAENGFDVASTLMIGDRRHDIEAAKEAGIACAGVLWGYGGEEELRVAAPDYLFRQPNDVLSCI